MTGDGMKDLRESAGMTQKEFGEYFDKDERTVRRWEQLKSRPLPEIVKWAVIGLLSETVD